MSLTQDIYEDVSGELTRKPRISRLRRWVGLFVLVILFTVVLAFCAGSLQAYVVTSGSMFPTIHTGDRIIVQSQKPVLPKRGWIVAVQNPVDAGDYLCKRVIGLPHDRIAVRKGQLYVNGVRQDDEAYVKTGYIPTQDIQCTLGADEYYVMGDNRDSSVDSTVFGPVRLRDFIGTALCVYWPPSHVKTLRTEQGVKADAADLRRERLVLP